MKINSVKLIEVESSAGTTYLQWDIRNRLTQITYPNSSTNTFGYNGFGARISKSDSTGNYTFMRNGTGVTAPVLSDSYAEYTPGISERRSSNSKFYHSDLKNTTTQTASNETISGTNQYDAFGNLINYTGTWNGPFTYGGAFGYQSDDDSGLMLLGHRYYDSSTGRFLSRDPIGDGANWYVYCRNNPITRMDHNGLYDKRVERIIRKGLGDKVADEYKKNPGFRRKVHDRLDKMPKGDKRNPDAPPEDIEDAARDAWGDKPMELVPFTPPLIPERANLLWPLVDPGVIAVPQPVGNDWWVYGLGALAIVVVGGAAIVLSGGSATPAVGTAASVIITGIIISD